MHLAKSSKEALFLLVCLYLCFAAGSHGVISPIWHSVKSSWKACGQGFVINPRLVSSSLFHYAHASRRLLLNLHKILLSSMSGKGFMQPDPRLSYSSRRSMLMLGVRTHRFPLRSVTAWLLRGVRPLVHGLIIFARSNAWLTWVELLPLAMVGPPFYHSVSTVGLFALRADARLCDILVCFPFSLVGCSLA